MINAKMTYENEVIINYEKTRIRIYNGKNYNPKHKDCLNTISNMKGYKYFVDDCKRISKLDIVNYLIEMTYDSVITWERVFDTYYTEYGMESYILTGNNLKFEIDNYITGDLLLGNLKRLYKAINRMTPGYKEIISIDDLVVKCHHKEMKNMRAEITPIDAYLLVDNKEHLIRVYYSKDKAEYFAYRTDLEFDGIPYCKVLDYADYIKDGKTNYEFYDLNTQSIMYSYGYNVSDNMPVEKRRSILIFLIESKILYWTEIIDHLEFLIGVHKQQGHENAVTIWYSDIDYIRGYIGGPHNKIKINPNYL